MTRRKITTTADKLAALREGKELPVTVDDLVYGTAVGDVPGPDVRAILELAEAMHYAASDEPSISWPAQDKARSFFNEHGLAASLAMARQLEAWRKGPRIVAGHEVPEHALIRDGDGTFWLRHGIFWHVARGAGPVRVWREVQRSRWPARGYFELVAEVGEDASREHLERLVADFEIAAGAVEFGDGATIAADAMTAVVPTKSEDGT